MRDNISVRHEALVKATFHYAIQLAGWSQTSSRTSSRAE